MTAIYGFMRGCLTGDQMRPYLVVSGRLLISSHRQIGAGLTMVLILVSRRMLRQQLNLMSRIWAAEEETCISTATLQRLVLR